ncbi:MAG: iron-sulfur cluster assembly accessory protein [SAR116 cluster bacterium]|nr:iron-sulfur cluster assembly accessory protein [SAR116 cluster bacterium]|tara:strand:- start:754 stop:1080 length:327 start_codon:yes stop_codon:yes gene_type:complete
MNNFSLSKNAAERIKFLLNKEKPNSFFRISVLGGGCSGFQYEFSFSKDKNKDDVIFKDYGISYLIDETSLSFLSGSKLEFVDELGGSYFSINNPNATANCGCGTSFSI